MSTGSGFFAQLRQWFRLHFWASRPKDTKLTNLASSRYIKGENPSRSVDVRYTKTPLLKLPCVCDRLSFLSLRYAGLETTESLARICQMLPGNSSHPSLYPLLDSVPFSRPRVRLGPSCRTALWDCLRDGIAFLLAHKRIHRRKGQNRSFGAKRSRGTKKRRTASDAVGEEKQRDFTIRETISFLLSDPLRRLPARKVFLYRVTV